MIAPHRASRLGMSAALLVAALVSAGSPARGEDAAGAGGAFVVQGELRLHGSNTVGAKLVPDLLTDYGRRAGLPALKIEGSADPDTRTLIMTAAESARQLRASVEAHGTGTAFPALLNGKADIGMASRAANEDERKMLREAGLGDPAAEGNAHVLSLDGVLVIVHPDNPVADLTLEQVRDLFAGKIANWSAVGGRDAPVTVYARDAKSGTFDTFKSTVLKGEKLVEKARRFEANEDLADAVAADVGAIGFVGFAYGRNAKPVSLKLACGLDVAPEQFLVRTEEYPLSRRLFLYTTSKPVPLAQDFVRYALSEAAQPIVEAAGFINLLPRLGDAKGTQARLGSLGHGIAEGDAGKARAAEAGLRRVMGKTVRLSTTFRFEHDKADLDARALADLARVAAWAKAPSNGGRHLVLVGHSSAQGDFAYNLGLSRKRASEVESRLAALGVRAEQVIGVGPVSPVGCEDKESRGALNRRVEVWVR